MPQIIVPVAWVRQETPYYCGPAAAQMTLTALGVSAPTGSTQTWQDNLWDRVKSETNATRPAAAGLGTSTNPAFPEQRCVQYQGAWKCWTTTPGTLRRLLNKHQIRVIFTVRSLKTDRAAVAAIIQVLNRNIPTAALVFGFRHWIVIEGYSHGDLSSPSIKVAGKDVNFFYIRDPEQDESIHEITSETLLDGYVSVVPAGKYKNKFVALGTRRRTILAPAPRRRPRRRSRIGIKKK